MWLAVAGYALLMTGLVAGLFRARARVLSSERHAERQAEWTEFRQSMMRQAVAPDRSVNRRPPRSAEPPMLRLLRDHFAVCLAAAIVFPTLLYLMAATAAWSLLQKPQVLKEGSVASGNRAAVGESAAAAAGPIARNEKSLAGDDDIQ